MPPQPLSSVNSTTPVLFHPKALTERPELAVLVSRAIAGWSEIEGQMGYMLVRMLGASAEPALAMYSALTSARAQIAATKSAAAAVLDAERLEMFEAVLRIASSVSGKRHHLAHRTWGYAESLPHALLLADGKDISQFWKAVFESARRLSRGETTDMPDWNRDKILVYKRRDLEEIIEQMDELQDYFYQLSFLIEPEDHWRHQTLNYLNSKQNIQQAIVQIRKSGVETN